jgi:hypothetical protein
MKIYKTLLAFTLIASVCSAQAADTDKTLVSWVTLNNKAIKGGSVLTVEHVTKLLPGYTMSPST